MFIIWKNLTTNNVFVTGVAIPADVQNAQTYIESHAKKLAESGGIYANCDFTIDTASKNDVDLRNSNLVYKKQRALDDIREKITALESTITPRRLREAVLGDNGWFKSTNDQITALRGTLK